MIEKEKSSLIDFFRLFFAFCIVAIHTALMRDYSFIGSEVIRRIIGIAVPFFFICSGYFLSQKLEKSVLLNDDGAYRKTIEKYFSRLAVPYCVWGLWYFFLCSLQALRAEEPGVEMRFLLERWFFSSPGGGLWYVQAILVLLIIMWIINNRRRYMALFMLVLTFLFFLNALVERGGDSYRCLAWLHKNIFTEEYMSLNFATKGLFFMTGVHLVKIDKIGVKDNKRGLWGALCVVTFVGLLLLSCYANPILPSVIVLKVGCVLIVAATCFLWANKIKIIPKNISLRMRKMSSMVYFMHMTFIIFGSLTLRKFCGETSPLILFVVVSAVLFVLAFILSAVKNVRLLDKIF